MLSVPDTLRTTMHTGKYLLSEYTSLKVLEPLFSCLESHIPPYQLYHVLLVCTDFEHFTRYNSYKHQDQGQRKSNALMDNILSKLAISQIIEHILLLIQLSNVNPKEDARYPGENAHNAIIPHQQGVSRKTDKRLADGGANGRHEQKDGHDEGFHVSRRFGKSVFEAGDGREDFAECDEDVSSANVRVGWSCARGRADLRSGLDPDVEWGDLRSDTFSSLVTTWTGL